MSEIPKFTEKKPGLTLILPVLFSLFYFCTSPANANPSNFSKIQQSSNVNTQAETKDTSSPTEAKGGKGGKGNTCEEGEKDITSGCPRR
jgi:hypothetical protein